jgi:hypothetical protein
VRVLGIVLLAMGVLACTAGPPPSPVATLGTPAPSAEPTASPSPAPTRTAAPEPTPTPDPDATPTPSPIDVLPYLTSEVTVVNLAAAALSVTVTLVDTASPDEYEVGTFEVQPEQTTSQLIVPSRFRLEFAIGGSEVASCTIDVADGEQLQFAIVESGAVLASSAGEPDDAAEMVVATSSRCRAGAEP